jgi:uncharacterized protein YndB with AHSA1/START domain
VSDRRKLSIERTFAAPAERVFDAFTNEEVIRRWWHVGPDWETPEARVDLKVGGQIWVAMRNPHKDETYGGGGRYTEVERPSRLAFSWLWDDDLEREQVEQLIEIEFTERDGETTVRFTHHELWDDEALEDHEDGWSRCFENLRRELEA